MERNLLKVNGEQSLGGLFYSVTILLLLVANIVISFVIMATGVGTDLNGKLWYTVLSFSLSGVVIIVSTLIFSKANDTKFIKLCGFKKTDVKYYFLAISAFVSIFFGLSSVNAKFIEFLQNFGYEYQEVVLPEFSPLSFILVVFSACLLPAVTEEIALRNIVLNGVKTGSAFLNAVIGGLMFSIYHMNPAQTPYQFIVGFVFSLIAIKSRSVIPTVIAHFLNNFAIIVINYFLPIFSIAGGSTFYFIVIPSLISLTAIIAVLLLDGADYKEKGGVKKFFTYASFGVVVCLLIWIANLLV
ncbi:MAG: CPBP family intramembrane metalloprotease [Clostridia bacterium]|nr:CPBP family intramembrane metalloprotease [Clostridia bacterium]